MTTHTPAAQPAGDITAELDEQWRASIRDEFPAGEMDDAALVEAMVEAAYDAEFGHGAFQVEKAYRVSNCTLFWKEGSFAVRFLYAEMQLAIARPVLQAQARRKALDEAAVDGEALMDTGRKLERAKIVAYLENKLQRMGLAHDGYNYVEAVRNYIKDTMP